MKGELKGLGEKILEVVRVLVHQGLIKGFGHVSARLVGSDQFLITGHIHDGDRTMEEMTTQDLVVVNFNGEKVEGALAPPEERFIHSCIYKARPDIGGAIHSHPLYSTALSIAGKHVLPVFMSGMIFAPQVPLVDDANLVDNEERGQEVARALGRGYAVVLRAHGLVTAGKSPEDAAAVALNLEDTAKTQILASCAGEPRALTVGEMDRSFVESAFAGHALTSIWSYYLGQARKAAKHK